MKKPEPPLPSWDERAALRAAGGNAAFLDELMTLFLKDAAKGVARIKSLARARRFEDLEKEAHRLKGASLTLSLRSLAESLSALEAAAREGKDRSVASSAERLATELDALRRFRAERTKRPPDSTAGRSRNVKRPA